MKNLKLKLVYFLFLIFMVTTYVEAQTGKSSTVKLGAYYFDGWNGKNTYQLSNRLMRDYNERKPIWGWITSKQEIMDKQIDLASNYDLSFFNFCWYYDYNKQQNIGNDEKNDALKYYLKSKNKNKLEFAIMVANHKGYDIRMSDWNELTAFWIELFKDPNYLKANGKPLISFFSIYGLEKTFGGAKNVKIAFEKFKEQAKAAGLPGITIAAVLSPTEKSIALSENSGYDVVTAYNHHSYGFSGNKLRTFPVDSMRHAETMVWNKFISSSKLPLIPTVTLNWDKRPQEEGASNADSRYVGFSGVSVFKAIVNAKKWVLKNSSNITNENIINVFAWNEYGEGAWLTPSEKLGSSLLDGLKRGLKN